MNPKFYMLFICCALCINACARHDEIACVDNTSPITVDPGQSRKTPPDPFRDMTVLSEETCETDNCVCGQWRCRTGEVCKEVIMPYNFEKIPYSETREYLYGRKQLKMCFCGEHPGCGYGTCRDGECYDHRNRLCDTERKAFVPCWHNAFLDDVLKNTSYSDTEHTCGRFACDFDHCAYSFSPSTDGKHCSCPRKYNNVGYDMPLGGHGCIEGTCDQPNYYYDKGGCLCNGELLPKHYSCYKGKRSCGTAFCHDFETCEMEMCVSGTVALGDVECHDGTCLCGNKRCEGYEVCVDSQCLCQGIKCDSDEYCNAEGRCVSRSYKPESKYIDDPNLYYPPVRYDDEPFVFTVRVLYDNVDVCFDIKPKPDMGAPKPTKLEVDCNGSGDFAYDNWEKKVCCEDMPRGFHTIAVRGNVDGIRLMDGKAVRKESLSKEPVVVWLIESIDQWGKTEWRNFSEWFGGSNLVLRATDIPDLTRIRNLDISAFKWVNDSVKNWKISSQVKVSESSKQYFPQLTSHAE